MRLSAYVLAAAVLTTGTSAALSSVLAQSPAASPSANATSAATSAKAVTVDTKDFAYVPATLTVPVGTKVTFKNSDPVAHTVTADDKSFDSKDLPQNATWSHVFDTAGTYKYTCAYHAYMHGTVIVK